MSSTSWPIPNIAVRWGLRYGSFSSQNSLYSGAVVTGFASYPGDVESLELHFLRWRLRNLSGIAATSEMFWETCPQPDCGRPSQQAGGIGMARLFFAHWPAIGGRHPEITQSGPSTNQSSSQSLCPPNVCVQSGKCLFLELCCCCACGLLVADFVRSERWRNICCIHCWPGLSAPQRCVACCHPCLIWTYYRNVNSGEASGFASICSAFLGSYRLFHHRFR